MKKLGILGGTFDPVHWGHIIIAQDLRETFRLDTVLFMPAWRAPHKRDKKTAPAPHRLAMLRAAIRGREGLAVSDIEIKRRGVSYTIDTVRKTASSGTKIVFFAGMDAVRDLPKWREIDALVKECRFVLMKRPGFDGKLVEALKKKLRPATFRALRANVTDIRQIDISSTEIRRRLRRCLDISHLVPPSVAKYIAAKRLYKSR